MKHNIVINTVAFISISRIPFAELNAPPTRLSSRSTWRRCPNGSDTFLTTWCETWPTLRPCCPFSATIRTPTHRTTASRTRGSRTTHLRWVKYRKRKGTQSQGLAGFITLVVTYLFRVTNVLLGKRTLPLSCLDSLSFSHCLCDSATKRQLGTCLEYPIRRRTNDQSRDNGYLFDVLLCYDVSTNCINVTACLLNGWCNLALTVLFHLS